MQVDFRVFQRRRLLVFLLQGCIYVFFVLCVIFCLHLNLPLLICCRFRAKTAVSHNYDDKKRNVEKDCSVYLRAAFIRGWRLILYLLVPAVFIRGWRLILYFLVPAAFIRGWRLILYLLVPAAFIRRRRLFEGGVYSKNYGNSHFEKSAEPILFQLSSNFPSALKLT